MSKNVSPDCPARKGKNEVEAARMSHFVKEEEAGSQEEAMEPEESEDHGVYAIERGIPYTSIRNINCGN